MKSDQEAMLAAAAEDKAYKFTEIRSSHDLARLLLEAPEMPCITENIGMDGSPVLVSTDFRTKDVWVVNGEEIYEYNPTAVRSATDKIEAVTAIIIE